MRRLALVLPLASFLVSAVSASAAAQDQALPLGEALRDLEVLLNIRSLNLSAEQLPAFDAAVATFYEAAGKAELGDQATPTDPKVRELRAALIRGDAPATLDPLAAEVARLRQAGAPGADKVQAAVEEAVKGVLDVLTPDQIAPLAPVPDPHKVNGILEDLLVVRKMHPDQFDTWRDDIAARLGLDLAGGNQAEALDTGLAVTAILNKANGLKDEELQAQQQDLLDELAASVKDFGKKPTLQWQRDQAAQTMLGWLDYSKFWDLLQEYVRGHTPAPG